MQRIIDLNGTWQARWMDHQRGDRFARLLASHPNLGPAISARVPGEIHLDLMRAGIIDEPGVKLNFLRSRWVEECVWNYQRTFHAPALARGERAWLVFDCLDLVAVIHLNGREVGRHANAFYPCRVEVTEHLRKGLNEILVSVEAGLYHAAEKPVDGYCGPDNTLSKRHWLRTVQSAFGWDWAMRLGNVGIRGPVRLEIASGARVDAVVVTTAVSDDLKTGTVRVRVNVDGLGAQARNATLQSGIAGTRVRATVPVVIKRGLQTLELVLTLPGPALWWPVGHGAQRRYTVTAQLRMGGRIVGSAKRRVGFRHVRVNQSPHPEGGQFFIVEINHKPIFLKGGNFVPADMIFARLDRRRYASLVARALEANFNVLRIWGGGLYESEDLYDLCDAKGILLWQEFIFACARYPVHDETFTDNVRREAVYQVRRLAHHPSLFAWCGNNEIEQGYYDWGYDRTLVMPCHALFHNLLPRIVQTEDGTRYYQPSSPYSPDHAAPTRDDRGDQHPWSIGFANTDFRGYRDMICRFPNEGGILGPTALPTVQACLPPGQQFPRSFAWEHCDNSVSFWGGEEPHPDAMLKQWLGKDLRGMSLAEYVFAGGIVQGEGLAEYIRNFRRRMFSSASAVFWMYNDCWPVVRSWTIVDYYRRRTPSFHPVRRAFQPLAVAVVREGTRIRIYGLNEGPEWRGDVRFGLFRLAGGLPVDHTRSIVMPANASTCLAEFPEKEWRRRGTATHGAFAILSRAGVETARDRLFLPLFKDMRWPRATVSVKVAEGKAVFRSRAFAWRVCLDLDGERALPDNFFDVLPGIDTVLPWPNPLGRPRILRVGNDLFA